ncbi:MAG: tetratricopeptide repeat protein [Cyclobacteriaceae bacterium]|nr:tetratricopeptide repeat protein [Cyclobacteriaceae bacterium HetDA_MAG_MS6]
MRILLCLSCLGWALLLSAQNRESESSVNDLFAEGERFIATSNWQMAYNSFEHFVDQYSIHAKSDHARYYQALSALKLNKENAVSLAQGYISDGDEKQLILRMHVDVANYHFNQQQYKKAVSYYKETDQFFLSDTEYGFARYQEAYALFQVGKNDEALLSFKEATYYEEVAPKAHYYAGYLLYEEGSKSEALDHFQLIVDDEEMGGLVTPFIAQSYLDEKQYDELVKYINERETNALDQTKPDLYRLLGEAYFEQGDYANAAIAFGEGITLSPNTTSAGVYYKAGYSADQVGDDEKAIENYKIAALESTETGQVAAFRLGHLYLNTEQKIFALNAFEEASKVDFSTSIQEQSWFLAGKINAELEQYDEAIFTLNQFIKQFPSSKWKAEAQEIVAGSYLRTSNYDAAIDYIESVTNPNERLQVTYQQVAFLKGQLVFNEANFDQAKLYLEKSLQYPNEQNMVIEANFLLAEIHAILNQQIVARDYYLRVIGLTEKGDRFWADSQYGIGYLKYNAQSYREALGSFSQFVDQSPQTHPHYYDGKVRLADCHYVLKEYDQAITAYQSMLDVDIPNKDYVLYQLGLTYALKADLEKSDFHFRQVFERYSQSHYADNALMQLGQTYFESEQFSKAYAAFDQFISQYTESQLLPYAYLKRGLCGINQSQNEMAKTDFVFILDNHISHVAANDAILGLQTLQKSGLEIKDFDEYLNQFRKAHPDDDGLEFIEFEQAKTFYFNQNYDEAAKRFQDFIEKYPTSSLRPDAFYYMGECFYRQHDLQTAIETYSALESFPSHGFFTRMLDKRGKALLELTRFDEAVTNYQLLKQSARNRKEDYNAIEGLMYAHLGLGALDSVLFYADAILDSKWKPLTGNSVAWMSKGKVYRKQGLSDNAVDEFIKVMNESRNENGAEAQFLIASIFADRGLFKQSNESLFELIKEYASYPQWTGRAYLLLADNYLRMDEVLQAKATLNSIIERSEDQELVGLAKAQLEAVETLENSLIQQSQDTLNSDQ